MAAKYKMAILDDYQHVALQLADWGRIADRVEVTALDRHIADPAELTRALAPYDIIFLMRERTKLPAEVINGLDQLKLILTAGPLNAVIDVKAAEKRGVIVSGTGFTSHSTIELTWALILAASKNLLNEIASVRGGGWQVGLGADLHGKTLGLLGLGNTGKSVARVAQAFGMNVTAWSQNLTAAAAAEHGVRRVEKDELFAQSDVISVHLRLSERSKGLVGAREFGLMKKSAVLVNTSRGPIVDQAALVETLRAGKIEAAAVDVYDVEPPPADHPYRSIGNLLPTPHIGYVSRDLYEIFFQHSLQNVEAWLNGAPIRIVPDWTDIGAGLPAWIAELST